MKCRICGVVVSGEYDLCEQCQEHIYRSRTGCAVYEGYLGFPRSLQEEHLVSLRLGHKVYAPEEIKNWGAYEVAREAEEQGFKYDRSSKPSQSGRWRATQRVMFRRAQ